MLFEPVGYIDEYEISALIFLIVIMMRYFGVRRFPNRKNHLYALVLWVTLTDMILDVISSFIIDHVFLVPLPVTLAVNAVFYSVQTVLPMLMTAYTLALADKLGHERWRRLLPLFLPGALIIALMLLNFANGWFFSVDPVSGYTRGPLFITMYPVCIFYMAATFLIAFRNRKRLQRMEYLIIRYFLVIVLAAMLVQFLYPPLLITGVAIALSVILMYFTIQNPDSMLDTATGAFTNEAMLAFLNDRARERDHVWLVAVKIRNMPRVNELLGISSGNLLLEMVSRYLRMVSKDAWVFRMRGSCFVAITRREADYRVLCERLDARVGQPWVVGGTEVMLQATVCRVATAEFVDEPIPPEATVNYLETVFLQDERTDNRIKTISIGPELLDRIHRRRAVENALREAIGTGEGLELYFQPLWSAEKKRFVSAEALLRFRHPTMGFIPPDEFVPIAESSGLVTAMDELVVRKACAFIRDTDRMRSLGLEMLEINISALEFMHRRLPELIDGIMAQYQVDPGSLCFEITETAATESFELLRESMADMCARGCRFALDDFGIGYANITQVIRLPFSMVKLDRSLLYGSEIVLGDLARMFARMERITVVEGVETAEQAELARSICVDYIQGYYYARPMCQRDLAVFLKDNSDKNGVHENMDRTIPGEDHEKQSH